LASEVWLGDNTGHSSQNKTAPERGATTPDPDHSDTEDRYIIVGVSKKQRPLIVSFIERGNQIRIISARELTNAERKQYEEAV
jgi:hypothetical protein